MGRPVAPEEAPTPFPATTEIGPSAPPALGARLTQPRTLISFAIGFGLLFVAIQRLDVNLATTWEVLRSANVPLYVLALVVYYVAFVFRSMRWRTLLRNVGYRRREGVVLPRLFGLGRILLLSWFANCLVPAKLGDAYRAYLLKRDADVSFSKTMGTVLAERILDLLVLFGLLGLAAVLAFGAALPTAVVSLMELALVLAVLLVVGLVAMRLLGGRIRGWLPLRLQGKYDSFEAGTLQSFRALPALTAYTVVIWLFEAVRLYLVMLSLGVWRANAAVPLFIGLAGALLTTVPITPAGLGFVESGLVSLLLLAGGLDLIGGMSTAVALSIALLDRSITYLSLVAFGAVLHLWPGKR
ncbi:MAG TPA: lysylphosphatidylglycerol synthase transmembrane domain-containing protein [Chloroflexota bacterium]|nr:lysylphosphatidylglycerol synthase transmembrane domain-containing protein [Chloroflexota bacterium]